jgi:hypothetical protein
MKKQPLKGGIVGESHVWDGPIDTSGFPMGKGSSSGANGMEIKKYPTEYKAGPITQRAKQ